MKIPALNTRHHATIGGLLLALAWVTAGCPMAYAEDELGRLFFTPERRQILDRQRQLNIQEKRGIPEDPTLTINGVVTRSSGKRTVWINGISQNDNETPSGVAVTPNKKEAGKVLVQSVDAPAGNAKVGNTVNRNTGESTDLLNGGRINVRRATASKPPTDR